MSCTIVLVEDNPQNSELARDLLELAGHQITLAATAAAFRDVVASAAPPALVLMDMALPDGDGMQLLAHLRAVDGWAQCVVVALTAHALVGDAERFMAAGFDAVLTKPIDTRSFVASVERWAAAGRRSTPAR